MNHITLAIHDIERSFFFYKETLGLHPIVKWDRGAYFLVGDKVPGAVGSVFWFCLNVDEGQKPSVD